MAGSTEVRITLAGDARKLSRRRFLQAAAAGAAGLAGLPPALTQEPGKLPRRKLPGTDLELTPIGYGSEYIDDLALVDHILKQGVNYIDTAWLYLAGNSERKVAEVLKGNPGVHVFTKPNKFPSGTAKEIFLTCFNESYERLGVKTVDIMLIHDARTPERVENTGCWEAFKELRDAGKAKWFGLSIHYGTTECVLKATELGWFNVIMVAWNFMSPPALTEAVKKAADKGIGIIAIKTCQPLAATCPTWWTRATEQDRQKLEGPNLFQAAIKWTLSHDFITSTVLAMGNYDQANEDLAAAREAKPTKEEANALRRFAQRTSASYCRGCGACERTCPQRIAIADTLRYGVYHQGYRQPQAARAKYASLPEGRTFAACTACGSCTKACPHGLPVREQLQRAHGLLA